MPLIHGSDHHRDRRSIRLRGYDYTQEGVYFVTICARHKECLFGEVVDGQVRLSECGRIVEEEWLRTAVVRPHVTLDSFVVMPNHLHGLIVIGNTTGKGTRLRVAAEGEGPAGPPPSSIGAIIGQFKSAVTRRSAPSHAAHDYTIWQRNYHEHIVRSDKALQHLREYVANNPAQWELDSLHPTKPHTDR
jgi:REP element-mobilizing transposase RayT